MKKSLCFVSLIVAGMVYTTSCKKESSNDRNLKTLGLLKDSLPTDSLPGDTIPHDTIPHDTTHFPHDTFPGHDTTHFPPHDTSTYPPHHPPHDTVTFPPYPPYDTIPGTPVDTFGERVSIADGLYDVTIRNMYRSSI
ncbi:hypothetical protein [Chitinophaga sp. CF118]|uniref:hypothetical protein n=1 Tax=Chitinophaga sp. CF118 TaxID=1884367 RepID=UPI001160B131|nr:hypothetical protein [Chitinophaga sp. CF118]